MTLHYQFPTIHSLSDVLPAIEGCPEFIVVRKETGITVVNYVMVGKDTFPPVTVPDGLYEASEPKMVGHWSEIRRECRGMKFDTDSGLLIARPLHKFFNLGEREDTSVIDVSKPHVILEKLDGSMITPFPVKGGGIRWGTKMGITTVSMQAEDFVATRPQYTTLAEACFHTGKTPIFEWCSNQQRIVIDQPEDRLVLLHVRHTNSGEYLTREDVDDIGFTFGIPVVKAFTCDGIIHTLGQLVDIIKAQEGTEGVVICFDDGHMVKVKSDWYVSLHRVKASIEKERDVARLIVTDKTDDLVPLLSEEDKTRLAKYTDAVSRNIITFAREVAADLRWAKAYGTSRKEYATNKLNNNQTIKAACFHLWDNMHDENLWPKIIDWARRYIERNSLSNHSFNERARQVLSTARWEERSY
jgi:RNA ligase